MRGGLNLLFGWWPVAASGVWLTIAVAYLLFDAYRQGRAGNGVYGGIIRGMLSVVRTLSVVAILFMVLWGFNYGRTDIATALEFQPAQLYTEELWSELRGAAQEVERLRAQLLVTDTAEFATAPVTHHTGAYIATAVRELLTTLNYPLVGDVRLRRVVPGGLLSFNTSGVYFPLTGEAHVDGGLHALQMPFTMAHELFHGQGVTDEGACNFLAYLATTNADSRYIQYSGHLTYYRYLGAAVGRRDPEGYMAFRQNLSTAVQADLDSIQRNNNKYREIMPEVRHVVYDNYLKSQGVNDGMASYSRIINLVVGYKRQAADLDKLSDEQEAVVPELVKDVGLLKSETAPYPTTN